MLKALGALFGASVAATAGSMLIVPFIILAVLMTASEVITNWLPYVVGLVVYAVVISAAIAVQRSGGMRLLLLLVLGLPPVVGTFLYIGPSYTAFFCAALVAATVLGAGMIAADPSEPVPKPEPEPPGYPYYGVRRPSPPQPKVTSGQRAGTIALCQNVWLAPTAVAFLTHPNWYALIAAVLGMIATFFVVEETGMS